MQGATRALVLGMVAIVGSTAIGPHAAAKSFEEPGAGEPPFGVAVQSDAAGTKLEGVVYVKLFAFGAQQPDGSVPAQAEVVVRVRKGNSIAAFQAVTAVANAFDPGVVQEALETAIVPQVIDELFGGDTSLAVTVKSVTEFGQVDDVSAVYNLADFTAAVK